VTGYALGQEPFHQSVARLRPPAEVAAHYREQACWRSETLLHDLFRAAAAGPDRTAIISHRLADRRTTHVSYGLLVHYVNRFAHALAALGIMKDDPVAYQLPNCWEATALILACMRLGAVAIPILPTMRERELSRILSETETRLCVVPDKWLGYPHAELLADLAPRLPWLRHRVVVGDAAATRAVDFTTHFLRTPHEQRPEAASIRLGLDDPDRVCLVTFTAGTGGQFRGVLHSQNTLYAGTGAPSSIDQRGWYQGEIFSSPNPMAYLAVLLYCVWGPILSRGTAVTTDTWDPAHYLQLISDANVTQAFAAHIHWSEMLEEQRRHRRYPALRLGLSGGSPMPPVLVSGFYEEFGVPMRNAWGMAELGMGIRTRDHDEPLEASYSSGFPLRGLETELVGLDDAADGDYQLLVRGPQVCLGLWDADRTHIQATWEQNDGWLETRDLVQLDGRGGLRIVGRTADRIGTASLIPVAEVEAELLQYSGIKEVAIIAYVTPEGEELPCAVAVPQGPPPTLSDLREHLRWRGMTDWYQPTRLEIVDALPRNHVGKVSKAQLRVWLRSI
jgi:cyclohexanecarboxylate-CoA ligase